MADHRRSDLVPARFGRSFLLPLGALVALTLTVALGVVWYSARVQDRASFAASIEAMRGILDSRMRVVGRVAKDYAWWDDAVRYLQLSPNADWADRNLAGHVYKNFGLELSLAVDAEGRTVYASVDGQPREDTDAFRLIAHGLPELVARARAKAWAEPEPVTGIVEMGGHLAIAGVSALAPEAEGGLEIPVDGRTVLVVAKRLDPSYLGELLPIVRVRDLRILSPDSAGRGEAALPLVAPDGKTLASLVWTPDRPGTETFVRVAPVLAVILLVLALATSSVLAYAKRTGDALQASEARFRDVADASSDWIWETDADLRVTFVSSRFAEAMGAPAGQVLGRRLHEFLEPLPGNGGWSPAGGEGDDDGGDEARTAVPALPGVPFRNLLCAHADAATGQVRKLRLAGVPIVDARGRHAGYRGTASDITVEVEAQSRASFLAMHDALTELPNRTLLQERLAHAAQQAAARGECAAVLCIDLDRFKEVNDTLGHGAGDRLLRAVAERLRANVRQTDTVARLGGDEFVVLHAGLRRPDDAEKLCHRLLRDLERPFDLGDQEQLVLTASIGVALLPQDGTEPGLILRNADIALLRAKDSGRNTFGFYERGMDARIQQRKTLERELQGALAGHALRLVYQPRVDLRRDRVAGAEALVRWDHPQRGTLLPSQFIQVAEESGLILPLGDWVLHTACSRAKAWPGGVSVAVNISPIQFKSRRFVPAVRRALERTGLEPERLELEVTEGVLLENTAQSLATLRDLRALGVRLSLDDFGTGHASLGYLLRFEFEKIKIDRSFVQGLDGDGHADAIVRSVLSLGHSLGMEVCAEGVETEAQLAFLRREGCDEAQGFLLSRPVPPEELEARLAQLPPDLPWLGPSSAPQAHAA